jgi:valyl-tRNA synthetase
MNVPPSQKGPLLLRDASPETITRARAWSDSFGRLARISELNATSGEAPRGSAQIVLDEATLVLPLAGLIDLAAERARLAKERDRAAAELAKVTAKLANADFVARAKPEIVVENRDREASFRAEIARLSAALERIL